jgi:hypothetical protein
MREKSDFAIITRATETRTSRTRNLLGKEVVKNHVPREKELAAVYLRRGLSRPKTSATNGNHLCNGLVEHPSLHLINKDLGSCQGSNKC